MAGEHDVDIHFGGALDHRVEFVHFEPEQDTIAIGLAGGIADGAVMVLNFKAVQLQDETATVHQLLILPAAVNSAAPEQTLIPSATGFDIGNTDERLWAHSRQSNR